MCAYLKLRTRISACFSTIRPCSLANLAFSHLRVFGGEPCLEAAEEAVPPSSTPAVLTMLLILMACSAQMPTLSITTGLDGGRGRVGVRGYYQQYTDIYMVRRAMLYTSRFRAPPIPLMTYHIGHTLR